MSTNPDKRKHIEELLRKSLLGSKIIDTQFHLFSTKSVSSGRVSNPHVLYANNELLIKSSKYFSNLLNSTTLTDASLIDIVGDDQRVPSETHIDDYGYASDSDLDDDDGDKLHASPTSRTQGNVELEFVDCRESTKLEEEPVSVFANALEGRKASRETIPSKIDVAAVQDTKHDFVSVDQTTSWVQSLNSRRIFVKDTAFRTWYALLYYLYTGSVNFSSLKSVCLSSFKGSLASSQPERNAPKCSAKSMFRLANKVGLEDLRDKALQFLRVDIEEHNILKELTSSLVTRYPALLEVELDVLYSHIYSQPIVTGLPGIARRIAQNEFPYGADIITGLHRRLLKAYHSSDLQHLSPSPKKPTECSCQGKLKKGKTRAIV